jgi:hypothetical protein
MKLKLEVSLEEAIEIIKNTRNLPDNERPVFLYMKQHNITGLLYFGRTVSEPYTYLGSGKAWKRHLKEYGNDISTIWLRKFENEDDLRLKKMAIRISKELDIVKSEKFANTVIEKGHNRPNVLPTWEYLNECFEYNADTGKLIWKTRPLHHFKNEHGWKVWNIKFAGKHAGGLNKSGQYLYTKMDFNRYSNHRIIWKLLKNEEPPSIIDHIDGNSLDNRIENLRSASKAENNRNRVNPNKNKTGFIGVSYRKRSNSFEANISYNGKKIFLGHYQTADEANLAYQAKSLEIFGEFSTVTQEEYDKNLKNTKIHIKMYKGNSFNAITNKYASRISHNGKQIFLGSFKTEEEASQAYKDAVLKYRGKII